LFNKNTENYWSPYPPEKYNVEIKAGVWDGPGRWCNNQEGLWNLVYTFVPEVDVYLQGKKMQNIDDVKFLAKRCSNLKNNSDALFALLSKPLSQTTLTYLNRFAATYDYPQGQYLTQRLCLNAPVSVHKNNNIIQVDFKNGNRI